ncbi:hypothetical protein EJB05_11795 [Eragrostis curvula]|uniref:Thioredoxin-like fold domain-containing protein n=1 Tax=Eragrostis curvula TaxID=38414 RepID=A0A5J9VS96_9POAL|nr:hypothetical protein EJB05_11795 [Eragrostis curvula]
MPAQLTTSCCTPQLISPIAMAPRLLACFGRRTASAPEDGTTAADDQQVAPPGPVLVELFSSQGCAASPEADAVAARLAQDSGSGAVVVLGFHVDYWDYRGWKDPFATSAWTVRQKAYVEALRLDTLFTPQVVVQDARTASAPSRTRSPPPCVTRRATRRPP